MVHRGCQLRRACRRRVQCSEVPHDRMVKGFMQSEEQGQSKVEVEISVYTPAPRNPTPLDVIAGAWRFAHV
eukprot:361973-Chlamydomonas_euryale.AAC.3